ncbi:phosphoenolpyruvate--protein phosphotransferase [Catenovulum agarivorans]|uniref:phosphoenolpyruvate--protein phosphotransferase n=1 Tax=Catenovulum agarivorans TaxID=1172192 RepID=UPI00036209FB|nr:phosphoenolpyruvate--protein phosphotransferase [Catenovulum agarivorans]
MKTSSDIRSTAEDSLIPIVTRGACISVGFAHGSVCVLDSLTGLPDAQPDNSSIISVEVEVNRLAIAIKFVSQELVVLATRVAKEIDANLAVVFNSHIEILNDKVVTDELQKEIVANLLPANIAVLRVFLRWEKRFLLMESIFSREKAEDFRDISVRLRKALAGVTTHPLSSIPEHCVLVVPRLLPSDTVHLANRAVAAILLEYGSFGSHSALFTRQLGIPCVSDISKATGFFKSGDVVVIDAAQGIVTLNPNRKILEDFQVRVNRDTLLKAKFKERAFELAVTESGDIIKVNANIGCAEDAVKAAEDGADGVGLYRLEHLYIGKTQPPTFEQLVREVNHTLAPFNGKSVCVRLLDVGSDKVVPYLGLPEEGNPALGRRGIRLMREFPELLEIQLKALLSLMEDFDLQILIPMVTVASDVAFVANVLSKCCAELSVKKPLLGAMIETPAAVLSVVQIAPYVDFFSFGTNDLIQYIFAADRESALADVYFNEAPEVIFRLIEKVHNDVPAMPLSVCGELAGNQLYTERLLNCGVTSLSVISPLVSTIKHNIRNIGL